MPTFDDRVKGHEAGFARNAELRFRAEARRDKLLGLWAAEQLGLETKAEKKAYAAEVVKADFQEASGEDVLWKVHSDLRAAGLDISGKVVRDKMEELLAVAQREIFEKG